MLLWLIISIPVIITSLVFITNQANLTQPPGLLPRLKLFITSNVAEISPQPVLPELTAPVFKLPAATLFENVLTAAESLGWQVINKDSEALSVQAVVVTSLWKFKDDVRIEVIDQGETSSIYAKSASRIGRGDMAANSHHLQQLLQQLGSAER